MNAVLIDDEQSVRETLKTLLEIYAPDVKVVAEGESVKTGLEVIKQHKPDLVLLDVEMKDGTGFDLMARIKDVSFQLIFVTGHDKFALKAFKFSALDYVLKPVDPDDLMKAIEKAKKVVDKNEMNLKLTTFFGNSSSSADQQGQKIVLKDAESIYLVNIDEIIRCQSEGNYTKFFLNDKREIMVSKTLKEYDQLFSDYSFFRPHQSHLINLNYFQRYDKKEGGTIVMKDGSVLPVSYRKKDNLMDRLSNTKK